jgi:subtilisin family serine protease/sugar lactone lactonase YvrE
MRGILLHLGRVAMLWVLCVLPCRAAPAIDWDALDPDAIVPGELVVVFQSKGSREQRVVVPEIRREALHARLGVTVRDRTKLLPGALVKAPAGVTLKQLAQAYRADPDVAYVEPNYRVHPLLVPNDPAYPQLWGMERIGAADAWDLSTGDPSVIVGVIDTGIRYTHRDLAANMWVNPGEDLNGNGVIDPAEINGIDDDGNGFIDDFHGWDFFSNDNDPMDDQGHGTHVAGTIGAVGNNGIGVVGVNWQVKLVAIRFLGPGGGSTFGAIRSIEYAATAVPGLRLTNNSWGGGAYSQAVIDMIALAQANGQLFIAAAGNSGLNADVYPMYPAAYPNSNIVSVASIDRFGQRSYFSNYGAVSVDIAAPGSDILSAWSTADNAYNTISGTSMATPHVAGAAALLWAYNPGLTWEEVRDAILDGARFNPNLQGLVATDGELDLLQSLDPLPRVEPLDDYRVHGDPGIPEYTPSNKVYTIVNPSSDFAFTIVVSNSHPWILSAPSNVVLAPLASTSIVVSIDAALAVTMPIGVSTGAVHFSIAERPLRPAQVRRVLFRIGWNYKVRSIPYDWVDPFANNHSVVTLPFNQRELPLRYGALPVTVLDFPFKFYDRVYTSLWVHAAGLLGVGPFDLFGTEQNQDIPDGALPDGVIAPYWDNIYSLRHHAQVLAGVETNGGSARFIISYVGVSHVDDPMARWSFQVQIRERVGTNDNDIIFMYRKVDEDAPYPAAGRGATIGLEDQFGIMVRRYSVDGELPLANEMGILFTQVIPPDVTPPTGRLRALGSALDTVRFEARFNEIVEGLDVDDFTVSGNAPGATVQAVEGGGLRYVVTVGGITGLGSVVLTGKANAVADLEGLNNSAAFGPAIYVMPLPRRVRFDDLEQGPGFWIPDVEDPTLVPTQGWEWGVPNPAVVGGPPSAFSGTHCWGTVLDGYYSNHMWSTVSSLPLDAGEHPVIRCQVWYDLESFWCAYFNICYDEGFIQVNNGEGWRNVTPDGAFRGFSGGWQEVVIPLDNATYGNRPIRVRFLLDSDFFYNGAGLYFDDFELTTRREAGLWVESITPTVAAAGTTRMVAFRAYNSTTATVSAAEGKVSVAHSGVTLAGTDLVGYGSLVAGELKTGGNTLSLAIEPGAMLDSPDVQLFHVANSSVGVTAQSIPFHVTGVPATAGPNRLTVYSMLGVQDWLGRKLRGDGGEGSAVYQVIWAGPDGTIDPPLPNGAVTGDDRLLYSHAEGFGYGRIGDGENIPVHAGKFKGVFRSALASNDIVYVRAWDANSFVGSVAYGDSTARSIAGKAEELLNFGAWVVGTPANPTLDTNGDSVSDGYSILNGLDPRASGPLAGGWAPIFAPDINRSMFNFPGRVAVWSNFTYVADTRNDRVAVYSRDLNTFVQYFGKFGTTAGLFNWPEGLTVDHARRELVVADTKNNRVQVLAIDPVTGKLAFLRQFGAFGGGIGQFNKPFAVAVNAASRIYVADTSNHRVQYFTSAGAYVGQFGFAGSGAGAFNTPRGIGVAADGRVLVADTLNHRIQTFTAVGGWLSSHGTFGMGAGQFDQPTEVQEGIGGRFFVVEQANHRVQVFSPAWAHQGTFHPPNGVRGSGPGQLGYPQGIHPVFDDNTVYVADTFNQRVQILRLILDRDQDGMDDLWEDLNGLDSSTNDAFMDLDGDGILNIGEYRAGTDPNDAGSSPHAPHAPVRFRMTGIGEGQALREAEGALAPTEDAPLSFRWEAVMGGVYEVQSTLDLATGAWTTHQTITSQTAGAANAEVAVPLNRQFYRVRWVNAP